MLGLQEISAFETYIDRHNSYLGSLLEDGQKLRRIGLRKDRVEEGLFNEFNKPKVLEHWRTMPGSIDQMDLGRLLVTVMSKETVRKIAADCCLKAGFMTRKRTFTGSVLLRSLGIIEKANGDSLLQLRQDLTGLGISSPESSKPAKRKKAP